MNTTLIVYSLKTKVRKAGIAEADLTQPTAQKIIEPVLDNTELSVGRTERLTKLKAEAASTRENELKIIDGKGVLKVKGLYSDQYSFQKGLLESLKKGDISEISVGRVVGPKILDILNSLKRIIPKGQSLKLNGTLNPKDLLEKFNKETLVSDKALFGTRNPQFWSEKQKAQFYKSIDELKIKEGCLKVYNTLDLTQCTDLKFELDANDPENIIWKKGKNK